MTTVNNIAGANTLQQTPSKQGTDIGADYNSFIKLLTAQVRNQDPLAPMDSTQFVEQLATFSSLEQLVNSNSALTSIASMIGNLNNLTASQWLGEEISFASSYIPYTGSPASYSYEAPAGTTQSVLTIKDANGNAVWSETLDPDKTAFSWNGQLTDGVASKDSLYEFVIDYYENNTFKGTTAPNVITEVTEIINEGGTLRLGTAAGLTVDLTQVRKV